MLKAWHLPVAPFIKVQQDRLFITLWLSGESLPQRITLRAEEDNEELSLPMQRLRQAPQPGVVAWRGEISLASGQPRRRYSFKLLWADHQRWFTPQGFTRFPPARLEQFAIDLPDAGPQWVADQVFYQIFPDRFARSAARDADQDAVYYHHAAGREIVRKAWDDPLTGEAGGSTFYGGDLDGITQAAKQAQQEAFVFGEHFGDARQWLQADAEDAAMNYRGFTFPIWGFLANTDISYDPQKIDAQTCMAWMDNYRAGLSHQQQLRMFNQLDSHDTARFKSLLGKDVARLPLAVVWLFSWPGVPCIYYGDEVGVDGNNDPFCRKPFPWDPALQDTQLLALYQRMAKLRKAHQALRYGGCQVIYAEDNVVVFVRVYKQQRVLVAINRGEACEVVIEDSPLLNVAGWTLQEGAGAFQDGVLTLPAISANVWSGR
ncbi:alpha amylase N-terminal ig-like domain-containing protein [Klebsiella pneumoniae]